MEIKKYFWNNFKTISGVVSIFLVGEFLNSHFLKFSPIELENNIFCLKKEGVVAVKREKKKPVSTNNFPSCHLYYSFHPPFPNKQQGYGFILYTHTFFVDI